MSWTLQTNPANAYLASCRRASQDDSFFNVFKRDGAYRYVLEHVSPEEGQRYLDETEFDFYDKLDEIKENDSVGSPYLFEYDKEIGRAHV